jgi:uncharacterized membrane protein YphA (DoxX/SURF4 family)
MRFSKAGTRRFFDIYQSDCQLRFKTLEKVMNTLLWACQLFLAVGFGYSGWMKSTRRRERLVEMGQTGVEGLPYPLIRFIGISELLGVIGIILPWLTGILPILTPVTAVCFAAVMVLAAPIHFKRKEYKSVLVNLMFFSVSVFVAYSRFHQLSI